MRFIRFFLFATMAMVALALSGGRRAQAADDGWHYYLCPTSLPGTHGASALPLRSSDFFEGDPLLILRGFGDERRQVDFWHLNKEDGPFGLSCGYGESDLGPHRNVYLPSRFTLCESSHGRGIRCREDGGWHLYQCPAAFPLNGREPNPRFVGYRLIDESHDRIDAVVPDDRAGTKNIYSKLNDGQWLSLQCSYSKADLFAGVAVSDGVTWCEDWHRGLRCRW